MLATADIDMNVGVEAISVKVDTDEIKDVDDAVEELTEGISEIVTDNTGDPALTSDESVFTEDGDSELNASDDRSMMEFVEAVNEAVVELGGRLRAELDANVSSVEIVASGAIEDDRTIVIEVFEDVIEVCAANDVELSRAIDDADDDEIEDVSLIKELL